MTTNAFYEIFRNVDLLTNILSQEHLTIMYSDLPKHFLYSAYKIDIVYSDGASTFNGVGTAFVVRLAPSGFAIVTNRHLLQADYKKPDRKYKDYLIDQILFTGRRDDDSVYKFSIDKDADIVVSNVELEDVAVIINPNIRIVENMSSPKLFFHFHINDFANEKDFEYMRPFDLLAFSGFPHQHDLIASRPIIREGRIASDPKFNYPLLGRDEGRCVAFEGFSHEGSSGSAMFAPAKGIMGITPDIRYGCVVGINAGRITGKYDAHTGISYFYKSTVILEILASLGYTQTRTISVNTVGAMAKT